MLGYGERVYNIAVGQNNLDGETLVVNLPIFCRKDADAVVRERAADRTAGEAAGHMHHGITLFIGIPLKGLKYHARLAGDGAGFGIDIEQLVHAFGIQRDAARDRQRPALRAGASAPGLDGQFVVVGDPEHFRDFFSRARAHHKVGENGFTARMVKNVKIAPSPKWMRERIAAMGMRPINNIVDITNYVMMEYGQPMHAFDFACVDGGHIIVRTAREGETIRTLDGNERKLNTSMLCICDEYKPVGVAGVMGGENSEITDDTKMVLFESANFNGTSIRRTAAGLGMRTDASAHYEKGLDPYLTKLAVDRACELVELLGAGEVIDGYVDCFPEPPEPLVRELDVDRVNWILGTDIDGDTMRKILSDLGFKLDGNTVTVPTWRLDIDPKYTQNDFAEEVARIYGFNNIPSTMMEDSGTKSGGLTPEQAAERQLGEVCRACGYDGIITYSFYSPASWDMIRLPADDKRRDAIRILNPLGEDTSCMRTTTLPSMLEVLARNWNYRNKSVKLYEFAKVYRKRADGLADEPKVLTLGAYGDGMDFYALKGAVEELCDALLIQNVEYRPVKDDPSYHPGRCAALYADGKCLGKFGQVHPLVAKNYGVSAELYAAELNFQAMFDHRTTEVYYTPLPRFPSVNRDIAIVCDNALTAGELMACIREAGGEYLKSCEVFDVYKGANIPEGKKSVAFSLILRADDQTLTDAHADEAVQAILAALHEKYGAVIR